MLCIKLQKSFWHSWNYVNIFVDQIHVNIFVPPEKILGDLRNTWEFFGVKPASLWSYRILVSRPLYDVEVRLNHVVCCTSKVQYSTPIYHLNRLAKPLLQPPWAKKCHYFLSKKKNAIITTSPPRAIKNTLHNSNWMESVNQEYWEWSGLVRSKSQPSKLFCVGLTWYCIWSFSMFDSEIQRLVIHIQTNKFVRVGSGGT